MQAKNGAEEARETPEAEEFRVTDRRRIRLDDDAEGGVVIDQVDDPEPRSGGKPPEIEQLQARATAAEKKLIEVQARFDQLRTQIQRETDEMRQRLNRSAEERLRGAKADFIASLLPVVDNLHRAIQVADAGSTEGLLEGVRGTASGFENALAAAGVEHVSGVGEKFDPQLHEAVDTIEVEPDRDETITAEYTRGYKIGERLLRPSRVQVGRAQDGE